MTDRHQREDFPIWPPVQVSIIRGMFEMNCLISSSSISTWGTIKTNTYLCRVIQYLHNGVSMYMLD